MADSLPIPFSEIEAARTRIAPYIRKTPTLPLEVLSTAGRKVVLKCELFQTTGSFKLRGATNCILSNLERAKSTGVVAASAGNHAQGVAAICHKLGIQATIVMPKLTQPIKVKNTEDWGATVVLHGSVYDESFEYATKMATENNLLFVHPFRDPLVIAGQGTIGLEMLEDPLFDDIEALVVAIGGGGLVAGVASAIKAKRPRVKIYGVTAQNAPCTYQSFKKKQIVTAEVHHTLADTIATKRTDETMLKHLLGCVDDVFSLSEEVIAHAIALLAEKSKLVLEGAGAIGVGAILQNCVPEKKVATILCGGNIDIPAFSHVIERGLAEQGRLINLTILIKDRPGSLHALTKVLAEQQSNILQVFHQRTSLETGIGEAEVKVQLETRGRKHTQDLVYALTHAGYRISKSS